MYKRKLAAKKDVDPSQITDEELYAETVSLDLYDDREYVKRTLK